MANFETFVLWLEGWGLTDVLLPFILIFTIVFAVLQKSKILGKDKEDNPRKNFNVIISLVMALGVIIPHVTGGYPGNRDPVTIINTALPNISVIVVAIIMLLLLVGVFGKELDIAKSGLGGIVVIASIAIVLFVFGSAADWWHLPGWLGFIRNSETQFAIITILIFAIIIWFITKDDSKKDPDKDSFIDMFKKALK